jgi:hypothetical protein
MRAVWPTATLAPCSFTLARTSIDVTSNTSMTGRPDGRYR